jgi:hypothetical protein
VVLIFAAYEVPMIASFENIVISNEAVSIVLTSILSLDMAVNLLVPRILEGEKLEPLWKTQIKYLQFGFFVDLVGAFPFDIVFKNNLEHPEVLQMLRFTYCRWLPTISSTNLIYHEMSVWFQKTFNVGITFMTIFLLSGFLLVFLHIHACTVFLFGKVTDYSASSWHDVEDIIQAPTAEKYIWALFSAVSNTFPVTGYKYVIYHFGKCLHLLVLYGMDGTVEAK